MTRHAGGVARRGSGLGSCRYFFGKTPVFLVPP